MATIKVFADTNTLYPYYICDLLLHCAEEDLFTVLWTEDLLTELIEVLPRNKRKSRKSVEGMCDAIRRAFPEAEVFREAYEDLIDQMPGKDADDHVHSAAAVAADADVFLTYNTRDFPPRSLAKHRLRVTNVDQFMCEQFAAFPEDLMRVLHNQVEDMTKSKLDLETLLAALDHPGGAPRFVRLVRKHLES
jgi:predicted nucleic acid-binding protein